MKENYYQILNISRTASLEEIKKAYRRLSKKYHPDSNPGKDAQEQFQRIAEAYAILQDPKKKSIYDRELEKQEKAVFSKPSEKYKKPDSFFTKGEQAVNLHKTEKQFEKFFGFSPK